MNRPKSITVVAWILVVLGTVPGIATLFTLNNPVFIEQMNKGNFPVSLQIALGIIGYLILLVSGIFILRAKNWARWLYTGWGAIGVVATPFNIGISLILLPGTIKYLIIVYFLFTKKANIYFKNAQAEESPT